MGVSDLPRVKSCCVFENERWNAFHTQLDYLYMNDVRIYISISIFQVKKPKRLLFLYMHEKKAKKRS